MAIYKSYTDLTEQQKQQFGDEQAYKTFMDANVTTPATTTNTQTTQAVQPTQPTLTDPSDFAQAQVGAAVQQPTLPQGGAVLPNLALQSVTPNQLQTTPGLQGTVAAATPAATVAPTIEAAAVPTATQVSQTTAPAANTYDYSAATTAANIQEVVNI